MEEEINKIKIRFQSDMAYIPSVRKYISDIAIINSFTRRFAFRTELIVDELCSNAVLYGAASLESMVTMECTMHPDKIEIVISNPVGKKDNFNRLQTLLKQPESAGTQRGKLRRGLKIVKILCDQIDCEESDSEVKIRIIKEKEEKNA